MLERLERVCHLARIGVDGNEPETAAEMLMDVVAEFRPKLPALRRAVKASSPVGQPAA